MATLAHNIERYLGKRGVYIAYDAQGFAFRVVKTGFGGWEAAPSHASRDFDNRRFKGATLNALAEKIARSRF
jgi:hypothetical protein